ncbi:MAG: GNAT family N-acetyltransferase [Thaumarchaeota archaeon]|nr:GNAT family N-acetyltransferase [Nitrososphaerota archaeon]MDD9809028.1 GNAT family N-acetyltransferase [Nitrososphaerota archaeon]MDD9812810.1 GNAT family N-acetyltransferase [Nitrososphaerota archaeon]MDD9826084.1 GNAT family N-acetyltransferase [Nitrososphaerota archaeon]MDD9843093.1 GNAT family N-acetyltransferase [Nitrososphaerota archaeon]
MSGAAGITTRRLREQDLASGFLESLDALRPASHMGQAAASRVLDSVAANPNHVILVAERDGRVIGATTLLIEPKFIHDGGLVGHIEDVSVRDGERGAGAGSALVRAAIEEARRAGCYKVVLECSERLVPFYERLGLSRHSVSMRRDLC